MSSTARILVGLVTGAIIGLVLAWWSPALGDEVAAWVQPIGRLWLNALQMTVVPLVLSLIVVGVSNAADAAASGRTARRSIIVFVVLLSGAAAFTALVAPAVLAFIPVDPDVTAALAQSVTGVAPTAPAGWADWITGIIPVNAVAAAATGAMLPLVVFALFLGFALTRLESARREQLNGLFQAIADAMIVIVQWVLWAAPLGVFALILAVCARAGLDMIGALGIYIVLECSLYLMVIVLLIPVAVLWGGESIRRFVAALAAPQAVAFSTQSSLATLPAMLHSADQKLRYPEHVAGLVLPMAVTLFRITSPMQYVASASFIAWALGMDLSVAQLAAGAALAVIVSAGSVGLPGQVSFMATNMPVTQAMGLPVAPLGLMLAVDTIPDMFATVGNVTADLTATSVVVRQSKSNAQTAPSPPTALPLGERVGVRGPGSACGAADETKGAEPRAKEPSENRGVASACSHAPSPNPLPQR